ncbi:MAG: hypothetical protein HYY16_17565 [Planctomycetes bacterium]|nr:hypothetical protein [Planctomycetota bacterium]
MSDSPAKRIREAKKFQKRAMKAERKRLRKEGRLGKDVVPQSPPAEPSAAPIVSPPQEPKS